MTTTIMVSGAQVASGARSRAFFAGQLFLILLGGALVAADASIRLPNAAQPLAGHSRFVLALLALAAVMSAAASILLTRLVRAPDVATQKRSAFLAAGCAALATAAGGFIALGGAWLAPLGYFVLASLFISLIVLVWTPDGGTADTHRVLAGYLRGIWKYRLLLRIWTVYNIRSRYSQTVLGILWIVLLPLSTALVLSFLFAQITHPGDIGNAPFISFFLTALTFWGLFSSGVNMGVRALLGSMGLINQVYFPREVLILVRFCEEIVDLSFTVATLLIVNAVVGIWPNAWYVALPLVVLIQMTLTLGAMFLVSYTSVLIRDVPQLIGVLLQLFFYLTPIIYPVQRTPEQLQWLTFINPLASLIDAYRRIIVYGEAPVLSNLLYPAVFAVILLFAGFMSFKKFEKHISDYK